MLKNIYITNKNSNICKKMIKLLIKYKIII